MTSGWRTRSRSSSRASTSSTTRVSRSPRRGPSRPGTSGTRSAKTCARRSASSRRTTSWLRIRSACRSTGRARPKSRTPTIATIRWSTGGCSLARVISHPAVAVSATPDAVDRAPSRVAVRRPHRGGAAASSRRSTAAGDRAGRVAAYDVRRGRSDVVRRRRVAASAARARPPGRRRRARRAGGRRPRRRLVRASRATVSSSTCSVSSSRWALGSSSSTTAGRRAPRGPARPGPAGRRRDRRRPRRAACRGPSGSARTTSSRPTAAQRLPDLAVAAPRDGRAGRWRATVSASSHGRCGAQATWARHHVGSTAVSGVPPTSTSPARRGQLAAQGGEQRGLAAARRSGDRDQAVGGEVEVERRGQRGRRTRPARPRSDEVRGAGAAGAGRRGGGAGEQRVGLGQRGRALGGRVELGADPAQRPVGLGGEQQHGERDPEVHRARGEPQSHRHRDQRDGQRGDQLEDRRGGEGHLEGLHRGAAVAVGDRPDGADLRLGAAVRDQRRQAADHVEEVARQGLEGAPLVPGAVARGQPDEDREDRHEGEGERHDEARQRVEPGDGAPA